VPDSASCGLAKIPRQRQWHRRSRGFGHVCKSAHNSLSGAMPDDRFRPKADIRLTVLDDGSLAHSRHSGGVVVNGSSGSGLTKLRLSIASPVCPMLRTMQRRTRDALERRRLSGCTFAQPNWSHQSAGAPRGAQDIPHWWEGVRRLLTEINLPSHYHFRSKQDRP
jgi:hypothetical protein